MVRLKKRVGLKGYILREKLEVLAQYENNELTDRMKRKKKLSVSDSAKKVKSSVKYGLLLVFQFTGSLPHTNHELPVIGNENILCHSVPCSVLRELDKCISSIFSFFFYQIFNPASSVQYSPLSCITAGWTG